MLTGLHISDDRKEGKENIGLPNKKWLYYSL